MYLATFFHLFLFVRHIIGDHTGCTFKLGRDTPKYSLILKRQLPPKLFQPNGTTIVLANGERFLISCADSWLPTVPAQKEITATCVRDNIVRIPYLILFAETVKISKLNCEAPPTIAYRRTGTKCQRDNELIEIGYNVSRKFLKLYAVCYDDFEEKPVYAIGSYSPPDEYVPRTDFKNEIQIIDNFYHFPSNVYNDTPYQRDTLRKILLPGNIIDSYESDNGTLQRDSIILDGASLMSRQHFTATGEQFAIEQVLNKLPVWRSIDQQVWTELAVIIYASLISQPHRHIVATGGYQVLTFSNTRGVPKELYLAIDDNANRYLPIPKYVWKLIYDTETETGTAFVLINHPFLDQDRIESLQFCSNICDQIGWMEKFVQFSELRKLLFCCDMRDFLVSTGIENMFEKNYTIP